MWLSDRTLGHLRAVTDLPDLAGTKYVLLDPIGRGGMATVYRARDLELDREVALKVLRSPDPADDLAARLIDEARILARLEHPGIVPVHDAGTLADGRVFCAMKLVRGKRLDALAAGPLDIGERLRIFQRICEAVAFGHAHGVLHRDLKPQNIMAGAFGEVLVMDWGVAGIIADAAGDNPVEPARRQRATTGSASGSTSGSATVDGTRVGTPGFMAPEQEAGRVADFDARTDVYGLGAILEYLLGLGRGGPRPEAPVDRRLRAICARATASIPGDRYPTVEELAGDVHRFVAGLPVGAYRERLHERVGRFIRKYRTAILLVLTYLIVRIVLIFLARR
jgi:serine/threonine protein kinase